ncbi:Tyrosine kinase [Entamoeba marina]
MKLNVLFLLFIIVVADVWSQTGNLIQYQSDEGEVKGWSHVYEDVSGDDNKDDAFYFFEGCCNYNIMEMQDFETSGKSEKYIFFSSQIPSNFDVFNIRSEYDGSFSSAFYTGKLFVYLEYVKEDFILMEGCFGSQTGCRSSISHNVNPRYYIYDPSVILYFEINSQPYIVFETENTSRYLYVDGETSLTINIDFSFTPSNTNFYLMTVNNVNSLSTSYNILSSCIRNGLKRYYYMNTSTIDSNCECLLNSTSTTISKESTFDIPDCTRNNTYFDLNLTSIASTELTFNGLNSWYSIIFPTDLSSLTITNEESVIVTTFTITGTCDVTFSGNVKVTTLSIDSVDNTFVFGSITIDSSVTFGDGISTEDILFKNLQLMIHFIITMVLRIVEIDINGEYYVDGVGDIFSDCHTYRGFSNNILDLEISTSYDASTNEYWNKLTLLSSSLTISSSSFALVFETCNFTSVNVTLNGDIQCNTVIIDETSTLHIHGTFSLETLTINGEISNLNSNGSFIVYNDGNINLPSTVTADSQTICFEFVSFETSQEQSTQTSYDLNMNLLSNNKLYRLCPSSDISNEVNCSITGTTMSSNSFDIIHCPCIDSDCSILVSTSIKEIDVNTDFSGSFILNENVVLLLKSSVESNSFTISSSIAVVYITDESNSMSLLVESSNQLLLLEKHLIFSTTKTKSLTQTTVSTNSLCHSLTYSINSNICTTCDGLLDQNGYCFNASIESIDNCYSQTEFGCEICYEGYESKLSYCNKCLSNCLRCYNDECINCEMNYQLNETNQCELISDPIISFDNNKTMKCNDGYYSNTNQCIKCLDVNCITCNSLQCLTCNTNYTLTNGNCQQKESNNGEEIMSNYGVIDCNDGYYSNNSQCIDCSLTYNNCELCNINGCLSCSNGVIINNGSCSLNTNCLNIDDSICLSCDDKGSWFNGNECIECGDNCKNCINGYCIKCNDGYVLQSENNCIKNTIPSNCITLSYYETCQRCSDGYYLNNNLCYECSNECTTCHNLTYCFSCNDGYMLNSNNECVDMSELNSNCKTAIPGSSGGCAICNDGYYRDQTSCYSCITNCTKCNNGESCLICESNYFLLNDASKCISYDDLTNCETPTQSGCTKCIDDTYYLNNQYCISCSDTTENCNTCNNNGECLTCQDDYVLIDDNCIHYQLIDNCKESSNSKCSSCSFWHTLNEDQTGCDTQIVWWVVVFIILVILIVLIGICVLLIYVIKLLLDWRKQQKQRKQTTIFDMKTSNVQFIPTNNSDVVINKNEILFNDESDEIGVNEETRDLICVGNTSKHTIKVQFSVKDGCDKYEIRTNPQLITIPKGKAVEFEIFIKPLCTCKINDQIMLISVDLTKGKTITTPITINTITIMSTRLDYSELIEDMKLGEGSFGIVYKGTFRGNQVAIKKMKQAQDNNEAIEEFNKEVQMLDKFRNDYIVHFYGAVFIPNKICMVTEFAQYGSLQDLMDKTKDNPIDNTMKMKILLDCSKGISYLHSNGILHRDIKPDNFLILSLDTNVEVNSKLTDFGSSRNINMMMTNMTFTKGIGTPVYMAPEILKNSKYKKSADIYSFAITIYETMIWDEAYPQSKFKFPWKIAEFVTNEERLPKPDTMNDTIYSLIDNCWKQDPKERYEIENVTKKLLEMN